jgi:hypothetical protein
VLLVFCVARSASYSNGASIEELDKLKRDNETRQEQLNAQMVGVKDEIKILSLQIDQMEFYDIPKAQLELELINQQASVLKSRQDSLKEKLTAAETDKSKIEAQSEQVSQKLYTTRNAAASLAREDLRQTDEMQTLKLVLNSNNSKSFVEDLQETDQLSRTTTRLADQYSQDSSLLANKGARLDAVNAKIKTLSAQNDAVSKDVFANQAQHQAKFDEIMALNNALSLKKNQLDAQMSTLNLQKTRTDAEHAQLEKDMNQLIMDSILAGGGLPDLSGTGLAFDAGYIINDAKFYTSSTMSVGEIQDFLNRMGANCHANCLKDYRVTSTGTYASTQGCSGFGGGVNMSAAEAISNAARACHISEKVLIVMLQKEQGLVTMNAPSDSRYAYALGYGCPDTSGCDPRNGGLFDQLYKASWQFNYYRNNPNIYNYKPYMWNNIQYSPNQSCGYKKVFVRNSATAGLYIYTPYTPNDAAINAGLGLGDSCSAYGNRNFYYLYLSWFGDAK